MVKMMCWGNTSCYTPQNELPKKDFVHIKKLYISPQFRIKGIFQGCFGLKKKMCYIFHINKN